MPRALVTILIAGLALFAPLASAQQQSTLSLTLRPLDHSLGGDTTTATPATVTYVADATVVLNTAGVPVTYQVTKEPVWASVTVSPASDVFMFGAPQPSISQAMTKTFTLVISVAKDAPSDALDAVEITAIVTPTMPTAHYASAKAMISVHVVNTQAPCDHGPATNATSVAPSPPTTPTPTDAQTVHVQSAAPASVPTSAMAIGGFAAVGAGAGFLLRRKS